MNYFYAALAGIIQGLTEFLPVSSSGHLVIFHELFDFSLPDTLAFDVVLHLGTLAALLAFFWPDVLRLLRAFIRSFYAPRSQDADQRLAWLLAIGTVPAVAAGYFFEAFIDQQLRTLPVVGVMLIVFGLLLWIADRAMHAERPIAALTWKSALLIGCAQALALIPGVSRSGATIIAGLWQKLNREAAARFSFLLSMPVVAGAGAKKLLDVMQSGSWGDEYAVLLTGFALSAVSGYLCIRFFLAFLQRHSLAVFVWYRVALGVAVLAFVGLT